MKAVVLTGYDKNGRMLEIRDIPMFEIAKPCISLARLPAVISSVLAKL